jgi:hypothetical protein
METIVREIVDLTPTVVENVRDIIPSKFPAEIGGRILDGVKTAAAELSDEFSKGLLG